MGQELAGARVLVLGYAYLENSDDTRNSPSAVLVERLRVLGAEVVIHDPYVPEYQGDVVEMAQGCAAVIIMVKHQEYLGLDWGELRGILRHSILVDGRRVTQGVPGFIFRALGRS